MRKFLTSIAVVASALVFYAATSNKAVEQAKRQTVLISQEGFLGGVRGSGILIDPSHVLTCAHMIRGAKDEFWVYTYPLGRMIMAHPESADAEDDIAILVLESSAPFKKAPVFDEDHYDGEHIFIVGNALGSMHWYVTSGVISGDETGYMLSDAAFQHGNSGGPWIDDKGRIVGMSDWKFRGPGDSEVSGVSGAVSAHTINEFFKALEQRKKMQAALEKMLS